MPQRHLESNSWDRGEVSELQAGLGLQEGAWQEQAPASPPATGEWLFPCLLAPQLLFVCSPCPGRCHWCSRRILSSSAMVGLNPLAIGTGQGSASRCKEPGAEKAGGPGLPLGVLVCSSKPLPRAVKSQPRAEITHGFSQP